MDVEADKKYLAVSILYTTLLNIVSKYMYFKDPKFACLLDYIVSLLVPSHLVIQIHRSTSLPGPPWSVNLHYHQNAP